MGANVWPANAVSSSPTYQGRALRQTSVAPSLAGASAARPAGAFSGVRPGTSNTIITATTTTWTVTPFGGVIDAEASNVAGPYGYFFDTNQTGSLTAAAGSTRLDRLDVQVSDPAEDGTGAVSIAIVKTDGVPGSGVTVAAPARSHPLAVISVPSSGSPTVIWAATYCAAAGGILAIASSAISAATYPGLYIDDPTQGLLRSNGTTWTPAGAQSVRAELKYTGAGISIPNGANTVLAPLDGTDYYNNLPAFTYNRTPGTFVCTRAGTYEFDLDVVFAANATGVRQVFMLKALAATPTTFVANSLVSLAASSGTVAAKVLGSWKVTLAVGDVVEFQVAQSSGAPLNVTGINLAVVQIV